MKKSINFAILIVFLLPLSAYTQNRTFFQKIAGSWEGVLEYQDYSTDKRVKLKTYLTITPAPDGNSAEFFTIYDDVSHVIKDREIEKIDITAKKYAAGDSNYAIESFSDDRIILLGSGQDGESVEPVRKTITFDGSSLKFLKETRAPWQFRNQTTLKRSSENPLAKRVFSAAQLKEDFEVLKKTLPVIHPGIYRYQTPESLDKVFASFETKLNNPLSENEFFIIVSQLANQIYCGHTFSNPYNQDSLLRERIFNGKTFLPFYFRLIDGKMIITENASGQNLSKGSEIKKINGVPVKQIIETLLTVTKGDGKNTLASRLQSIELPRFEAERYALFDMYFPLFFPLKDESYTIEAVDFASKKTLTFQTMALTKAERTAQMEKLYGKAPTYDDGWKFEIQDNSLAYLKIDNSITWRLKNIKFKEFLADAFAQIRAKNIQNLSIDIRGNGGGDMNPGYEVSKYLAQKTLPVYAEGKRLVRVVSPHPDLLKYLDTYSDELKANLRNGLPPNSYRKENDSYYEILPNENLESFPNVTPYENNFRGNAYLIADSSNASASYQFLDYIKKNKLAVIVGQESGGNEQGINGGNYFFLSLPNSKIEIDIPVYFQAPLTPQKDSGVMPDIYVKRKPESIGLGIDEEVEKIKELIRKR